MSVIYFKNKDQRNQLSLQEVSQRASQRALSRIQSTPNPKDSPVLKRFEDRLTKVEKGC